MADYAMNNLDLQRNDGHGRARLGQQLNAVGNA
jgi:hypothetical protein